MAAGDYNNPVAPIVNAINAMDSSRRRIGAVKFAQFRGETDRHYELNASMILTLDKRQYPKVTNTKLENYRHIPESGRFVLANVANYLITEVIPDAFNSESSPEGIRWNELAPATIRWREWLNRGGAPILNVSGSLRNSLTVTNLTRIESKVGQYARLIISPHGIPNTPRPRGSKTSAGNERTKFYVHGLGYTPHNIPPRPFMPSDSSRLADRHKREIRRSVDEGYEDYLINYPNARPRPRGKR